MTIHEIFDSPAIREIEVEILNLQYEVEKSFLYRERNGTAIEHFLSVRKTLLDKMFVLDANYKFLLSQFNHCMTEQLKLMRQKMIEMLNAVETSSNEDEDIECVGKCFLGDVYPKEHPVQTMRAKKMWAMLNGSMDSFIPIYDDGIIGEFRAKWDGEKVVIDSENQMLFLDETLDNWDEGLDRTLTQDMHLTYAFHNLWKHLDFSIYDLLWVRDFDIEIEIRKEYRNYNPDDYDDDLDWKKADYFD